LQVVETALALDRVVYCEEILTEIIRVLTEKLGWEGKRARESLRIYLQDAIRVRVYGEVHGVCRDPKDDMVIECATNGVARTIVTGDKDLLTIKRYKGIRILTARQYVDLA
jgi:putative PIN family toxin of toxin-antitoxin system